MQIKTNGQRNITLDKAPRKFKLLKDGVEIPYMRTGANSFRIGRNIDGVLDLEEVIEQPRIVKPMQLQAQQMALVNPNDVLMINQAAQQLEAEQNILSETQKRVEQTQAYLDVQQQRINESVLSVQGLETDNSERITATENGIFNLAGELAKAEGNSADADNYIISELDGHKTAENPHGITKETIGLNKVDNTSDLDKPISKAVQSALDEKADKDEIQAIRDELGEYQEKNDRFTNALSNYTGGLAVNQLPDGGLTGQVLGKKSDISGDIGWIDSSASVTVDDELSLTSENPVQNKVITSNINSLQTSKQDVISDLATIRSGAALGATAIQPSDLATVATSGSYNDLSNKPTIPAAQVNSDWNATSGVAQILNKPTIPTVPTNVSAFTNDAGYITSSALSGYATETYVDNGLATKQDVLTSENAGTDISITTGTQDVLLSGVSPLALTNAVGLNYIKALGVTEQNGTPTPSNPVDIVCNNGILKIKNLFDGQFEQTGYFITADGVITQTSSSRSGYTYLIQVLPNTTYTFSSTVTAYVSGTNKRIHAYDVNGDWIEQVGVNTGPSGYYTITFTTPSNCKYVRFSIYTTEIEPQLEQGSTATSYIPYGQVYADGTQETVNITNGGSANAEMLLQVGNNQDNQELLTGNVTRNIGIKVFDGTENWEKNPSKSIFIVNILGKRTGKVATLCSHYVYSSESQSIISDKNYGQSNGNTNAFFRDDDYTTVDAWKQYLAEQYANGTPVIFVYPLATSTTETVTGQTLTASGNCTVTATGSLDNLELEASYKSGTGATLISFSNTTGYATQAWVGQQGYITGITSSDVTTALGYTPYNASNPSGYITSSALSGYEQTSNKVTSISSSSTDAQYPSAKCVYDIVGDIETALHTINSGGINAGGSGGSTN